VWGVCYEIECADFNYLYENYEKGYDQVEVWTLSEHGPIIAKTFYSRSIWAEQPLRDYVAIVVSGAKERKSPDDYIVKHLTRD
jgi:hypothetical protein